MKVESSGKIIKQFAGLRSKTQSHFIDGGSEDKKQNDEKSVIDRNLKFKEKKNRLQQTQLEDYHLEKDKIDMDSLNPILHISIYAFLL